MTMNGDSCYFRNYFNIVVLTVKQTKYLMDEITSDLEI